MSGPPTPACGPSSSLLRLGLPTAASTIVQPLVQPWIDEYRAVCPTTFVATLNDQTVCANSLDADFSLGIPTPADASLVGETNFYTYACNANPSVSVVAVHVASIDIVVVANPDMVPCLGSALRSSLTWDQLRWMVSDFSEAELLASGWTRNAFSDFSDFTHNWSELNLSCPAEPVIVGSTVDWSGVIDEFLLEGNGESLRNGSVTTFAEQSQLLSWLETTQNSIGLLPFPVYDANRNALQAYDVDGVGVSDINVEYPLHQDIFMNVRTDLPGLETTMNPFLMFGLGGTTFSVFPMLYTPSSVADRVVSLTRVKAEGGVRNIDLLSCGTDGPDSPTITMVGSPTVALIAELWARVFKDACGLDFRVEVVGSTAGADRLCEQSVDIALMSRQVRSNEATVRPNGYLYECADSSVVFSQIRVANDVGVGFATRVAGGIIESCVALLGGLSLDQLRWMYTSLSEAELVATGTWDSSSVPNSDKDESTHLWSELDGRCEAEEIILEIPPDDDVIDELSQLLANGESLDWDRFVEAPQDGNNATIMAYSLRTGTETDAILLPSVQSHSQSQSNPLYMNINRASLVKVRRVIDMGLLARGSFMIRELGFEPLDGSIRAAQRSQNLRGSSFCFSDRTTVRRRKHDGTDEAIPIQHLLPGDYVRTGFVVDESEHFRHNDVVKRSGSYSKVYLLGHYDTITQDVQYLQLVLRDGTVAMEISAKHMVFVKGRGAIRAEKVRVGDRLMGTIDKEVSFVRTVSRVGAYGPLTESGTILVNDGFVASTYVSLAENTNADGIGGILSGVTMSDDSEDKSGCSMQWVLHQCMSPIRLYCRLGEMVVPTTPTTEDSNWCSTAGFGKDGTSEVLALPQRTVEYLVGTTSLSKPHHLLVGLFIFCLILLGLTLCVMIEHSMTDQRILTAVVGIMVILVHRCSRTVGTIKEMSTH